ncbi:hypothetical protein Tco_1471490 [Tanacetum coccineum]
MLRCFFLVSGLKINVQKSNTSGVFVPDEDVADMAKIVGCGVTNFPLKYLARLLSIGRCLSLIKSVLGGRQEDNMEKWKKCLASKKLGGLGIGSIYALNLGLLFKWIWRFRCHSNDHWARVIKNVYGHNGGIHDDRVHPYNTWGAILSSVKRLKQNGTDLLALCVRKIGNGVRTSFWNDNWCGNSPLKTLYPRIYMLDYDRDRKVANWFNVRDWSSALRRLPRGGVETSQFNALLSSIQDVVLSDQNDSWMWTLNASIGFTVASTRSLNDANSLVVDSNTTR